MNDEQIEKMVLDLVCEVDYDIYKSYLPACSEDPDEIPERMSRLRAIVRKHLGEEPTEPTTIREWQKAIHDYAKAKGWWDKDNRTFGDICTLFTTEISEAYEEWRNGHELTEVYESPEKPGKPEGVPVELADVVIRILDYCGRIGIDLQEIMERKHAFNQKRPYRHGGKRV